MTYSVIYLIDCSKSMNKDEGLEDMITSKLNLVKKGILDLIANGKAFKEGDKIAVMGFKQKQLGAVKMVPVVPLQSYTPSLATDPAIKESVSKLVGEGGTPIARAIRETITLLMDEPIGKKGIMLITDSSENSGEDPRLVVYDALLNGVRIDIVGLGTPADDPTLKPLAERTGGRYSTVVTPQDFDKAIVWDRFSGNAFDDIFFVAYNYAQLKGEARKIEEERAAGRLGDPLYSARKSEVAAKIEALKPEIAKKLSELHAKLDSLKASLNEPINQLIEMNSRLKRREIDADGYFEIAAPIEEKVGRINCEIAMVQQLLDSLNNSK
uniref:VWA domain-containing protein n=1 Tax=Candidatus Methanomethylicus mesodigestus TaxID=1867258 RepID=A0A7C3FD46_9CREN